MSSFDPSESTVGRSLDQGMDLFRRAHVGDAAPIKPLTPRSVLLVLDGSGQDACSKPLAAHLKARFGCELHVADARESDRAETTAVAVAEELRARALPRTDGESYEQILAAIERTGCDLAIVPCPFGREPESVGPHSAGLTTDMLLARSPVPLLVVRWPFPVKPFFQDKPEEGSGEFPAAGGASPFAKIGMTLVGENDAARPAAAWATGLVSSGGGVQLELLLEEEFYQNVRAALFELDPDGDISHERLTRALRKEYGNLHAGLSKAAEAGGFAYELMTRREESAPNITAGPGDRLVILPLERGDHHSEGHVADALRRTANPILVVPTAVRG
ncbi:universal stress protein [Alienimonas chondri]|uniref:Universal stress protein n=1 Tax=Alienimonas chondri TaxID=2681879 RepID=A0ABX1VKN7_9PLAN|nr:universal stress protein [Alienimonas chondri]NNJ27921.1 hypothetical protein [Alienimonas chondri]